MVQNGALLLLIEKDNMDKQLLTLINKYMEGGISEEEFFLLRRLLGQHSDEELRRQLVECWRNQMQETIPSSLKENMLKKIELQVGEANGVGTDTSYKIGRYKQILRIAAVILVLLGIGFAVWYKQYTKVTPPVLSENVLIAMKESKEMNPENKVERMGQTGKQAMQVLLSQYCKDEEVVEDFSDSYKMSTLNMKDGWLTLDDGTVVHLNGNSRLFFPEHFKGAERNVILDGEAYFMVAKDKSRPFVVHTSHGDIREYGTEFNVMARSGKSTEVVLVEGSIGVTPIGGTERMMQPNMMCRISGNEAKMEIVDTEPYKAWNIGKFVFHDWQLERIMNVLARWYGVTIEYGDSDLRHLTLSGTFNRYDGMMETMQALEAVTGTRIQMEQGKVIINNIKF